MVQAVTTVAYWDVYDRPETLPPLGLGVTDFWWYDQTRADELRAAGSCAETAMRLISRRGLPTSPDNDKAPPRGTDPTGKGMR